jgi:hypothetical protein
MRESYRTASYSVTTKLIPFKQLLFPPCTDPLWQTSPEWKWECTNAPRALVEKSDLRKFQR